MPKLTTSQFMSRASEKHGGTYDYTDSVYTVAHNRLTIICKVHGKFEQKAYHHLNGAGCPACAGVMHHTTDTFVEKAKTVHGDTYDYSLAKFTHNKQKVTILCRTHGAFEQTPNMHLRKAGCPHCYNERRGEAISKDINHFVSKSKLVHGDKYDYSLSKYVAGRHPIDIVCSVHGKFTQAAHDHMHGYGCPKCGVTQSKGEDEVDTFVREFGICTVRRSRKVIAPLELDIYIPELNLAIEYCGEYHHSDLRAIDAKTKHVKKYQRCAAIGIRLITVYESEWKQSREVVEKVIKTAIGKVTHKYFARKLVVSEVNVTEARAFFAEEHLQGAPVRGTFYGLYSNDTLVACMAFAQGASIRGDYSTWELLRYASSGQVVGGASKLFSAFLKGVNPSSVVSFSDNRWFGGGMYAQLGFDMISESAPDYQVWSGKMNRLYHKSLFQRKALPVRIKEHGKDFEFDPATDPRTERDITSLLKCGRIYDCGKKKWLWTNPNKIPLTPAKV